MKAVSPRIKALTICPGFVGTFHPTPLNRGLVIDLTGGQSVHVAVTPTGIELRGASEAEYTLAKPVVKHYTKFLLKGGECPSAPAGVPTTHQLEMEHEGGFVEVIDLDEARETDRVKALRGIVKNCQAKVVEGVLVDLFSAGTFIAIFDTLRPELQQKFLGLSLPDAIQKAYLVMQRVKDRKAAK